MRTIKFRGQSTFATHKCLYGSYLVLGDKHYILPIDDKVLCNYEVIPETVGQFTGLTDKNGVKIFEGDIITVNSKIVKQVRINNTFLAVQVANKEDLKLIDLLDPWQTPGEVWWNDFGREIIVIGNVHDNPELLNNHQNVI